MIISKNKILFYVSSFKMWIFYNTDLTPSGFRKHSMVSPRPKKTARLLSPKLNKETPVLNPKCVSVKIKKRRLSFWNGAKDYAQVFLFIFQELQSLSLWRKQRLDVCKYLWINLLKKIQKFNNS